MKQPYIISIAPMMDYTDTFFRVLMRFFTKKTWLYTEMINSNAIVYGNHKQHLEFDFIEKPVVLQLGGNNANELAQSVSIANDYQYDEINLNVGCPSDRVQHGGFGAYLMADKEKTQRLVEAMCKASDVPITVKCRIGIDGRKISLPYSITYEDLLQFATCMYNAGASRLIVHARIAVLGGLSPKENRTIPPLQYHFVQKLKQAFHDNFFIEVNGGITTLEETQKHLQYANAVMIGRGAVDDPCMFFSADALIECYEKLLDAPPSILQNTPVSRQLSLEERHKISLKYAEYLQNSLQKYLKESSNTFHIKRKHSLALQHVMNIYAGLQGAKKWRHALSSHIHACTEPLLAIEQSLRVFS